MFKYPIINLLTFLIFNLGNVERILPFKGTAEVFVG